MAWGLAYGGLDGEFGSLKRRDKIMNMQGSGAASHWDRSKSLLFTTLAIWFVFSFEVHWFGEQLNGATGSFPGGYFMAGQGSQIAFVILIFWFVSKQNKLDEEFDVAED